MAPEEVTIRSKPYASRATARGVVCPHAEGEVRYNLPQAGGPSGDAAAQRFKIVEGVPDIRGDPHPMAIGAGERVLESIEKAPAAGDGQHHAAQFADHTVPYPE